MTQRMEKITKECEEAIHIYSLQKHANLTVLKVLEGFEGKQINARISTAIKKKNPNWSAYYTRDHFNSRISLWGDGIPYENKMTFYLETGYNTMTHIFNMEKFMEENKRYNDLSVAVDSINIFLQNLVDKEDSWEYMTKKVKEWEEWTKTIPWPASKYYRLRELL